MKVFSKTYYLIILFGVLVAVGSCTPKNVVYFQDLRPGETELKTLEANAVTVMPEDKISIIVNSRDEQLTNLFNLKQNVGGATSSANGRMGYTVSPTGEIDFPVLGKIKIGGMNRQQIAEYIKKRLIEENLVKDPIVTVEFINLGVSVLGEVGSPGRYDIDRDHYTILDAIAEAGDLTINGNRDKVMVMRNEDGTQRVYAINLTSAEHVYTSPVYYLQQNDVVYVEPNNMKVRQSTVNGNSLYTPSFWMSLWSFVAAMGVLLFK